MRWPPLDVNAITNAGSKAVPTQIEEDLRVKAQEELDNEKFSSKGAGM